MAFPWEKQDWETARAYGMFEFYRDLGPNRSLRRAIKEFKDFYDRDVGPGGEAVVKVKVPSTSAVGKWAIRYNWASRAEQFDVWIVETRDQQMREMAQLEWELKTSRIRKRHELISENMTKTAELGFKAIFAYLENPEKMEALIEGRGGKNLPALISALRGVAESGTSLDERSLGIDAMMIEYENGNEKAS